MPRSEKHTYHHLDRKVCDELASHAAKEKEHDHKPPELTQLKTFEAHHFQGA
jgi:hypothetical protein